MMFELHDPLWWCDVEHSIGARMCVCAARRYDVFLFSKPDTLLALVSLPVVKIMQMRYVKDSAAAVANAVK